MFQKFQTVIIGDVMALLRISLLGLLLVFQLKTGEYIGWGRLFELFKFPRTSYTLFMNNFILFDLDQTAYLLEYLFCST